MRPRHIKNPLTLIGVFAGVSEVAGTGVLPLLEGDVQSTFVWFVMVFPFALVLLFFGTLIYKPVVIYGPADYRDESLFVSVITGAYGDLPSSGTPGAPSPRTLLRNFWKPEGTINNANERRLKDWMSKQGIATNSITFLLNNDLFQDAREKAVEDLQLKP